MEILCVHRWGMWMDHGYPEDEKPRNRKCNGICGVWQLEGHPEPEVVVARIRSVA